MVRALASHQCGPGSIPGLGVICGMSLLLVLVLAPRGFSPGTPVFPSPQKPAFPNSKFDPDTVEEEPLSGSTANPYLFIYSILFYLFLLTNQNFAAAGGRRNEKIEVFVASVPSSLAPSPPFFSRVLAPLPLPRFRLLRRLNIMHLYSKSNDAN